MKKEYRGKFGNFVHEERKKEEETLEICEDILKNSRNEMFYPQLGVKTLLDGGRRRTKNLYGVVKRTVPAGQVRQ